jgi:hypothetical protein
MKRHGSLNHIYRLAWSSPRNAWIAVAETTRGRGKTSCRKLIAAVLALSANAAIAEPLGGQVIAGAGNIAQSGVTTTVTQSSQTLSLNWQSFNIAAAQRVNFVQPSAAASRSIGFWILVDNDRLSTIMMPAAKKTLHGRSEVGVAALERMIELGKKERVVADHSPHPEQRIA